LAKDTGVALRGYLDSFDRDTRLLAELAQGTRRQSIGEAAQDRGISDAFQALATVVPHYRTIELWSSGRPPLVAIDPTEDRTRIAPALVDVSAAVAEDALARRTTVLRGPVVVAPARSFYIYAAPVARQEAVVVTADAAMMLEMVSRAPTGEHQLVVRDPAGAVWLGCERRERCRLLGVGSDENAELLQLVAAATQAAPATSNSTLRRLGLPSRVVAGQAPPVESPLGAWSVALVASAAGIDIRQGAFLWQLVLTSIGVALAMLTVGLFMLRQHATAAALGARLQTAQEVATLRERSEKILDNVPVGIVGIAPDGKPASANRFFHDRIGPNTVAPRGDDALGAWVAKLRVHLDRALASGHQQVTDVNTGKGGERHDYHVRVVPLSNPTDDIEALAVVEDLSELHSLQRQLVRAEKLVTVGVLSAGIAHEVGTPLMVIRGRAEHLLERAPEGSMAEDLRAIVAQIEFSAEQPAEVGPVDAAEAAARALELLEWRITAKRIAARLSSDDDLPSVAAAPDQFEQVVMNLLMNACDASDEGGAIEIKLSRAPGTGRLRLEVTDHGVGIPPENLNAVFDPYFTTKKRGEGTGLGLAIVSQIVRSHDGRISLRSVVGAGTTATVLWPLAPTEAPRA
jgi:signal transduction histidine kinase